VFVPVAELLKDGAPAAVCANPPEATANSNVRILSILLSFYFFIGLTQGVLF